MVEHSVVRRTAVVAYGSKREELRSSKSGPLWLNERTCDRRGATLPMGQKLT